MQFPSEAEVVDPIDFKDEEVSGLLVRSAELGSDLIIQILQGSKKFPAFIAQRAAKALVDTIGEPAMESVKIEMLTSDLIEGGSSVYIKCRDMNTDVIKSIMSESNESVARAMESFFKNKVTIPKGLKISYGPRNYLRGGKRTKNKKNKNNKKKTKRMRKKTIRNN